MIDNLLKIGTTQAVISRIENGSVDVGIDMIERIAKSFNKQIKIASKKELAYLVYLREEKIKIV